jgi:hypothetical protein
MVRHLSPLPLCLSLSLSVVHTILWETESETPLIYTPDDPQIVTTSWKVRMTFILK